MYKYTMEPVKQTTLDLMMSTGFIKIMLLVWSPIIIIAIIWLAVKYYKNKKNI